MSRLICYRAAAGAGKTHQIVAKYFSYLLQPTVKPSEVIALTFTNKAAQELKERILSALDLLIQNPLKFIQSYGFGKENIALLQKKGVALQESILLQQEKWNVSTLDAYFSSLYQSFSFELAVPKKSEALLVTSSLLDKAIQELLGEEKLVPLWKKLIQNSIQQGSAWDLTPMLKNIGDELLKSLTEEHFTQKENWEESWERIKKDVDFFSIQSSKKSSELYKAICSKGWGATDFKWGKKGLIGWLEKASSQPKLPNSYVTGLLSSSKGWAANHSLEKKKINDYVELQLHEQLSQLIKIYKKYYPTYHTYQLLAPLQYSALLQHFLRKKIDLYCKEEQVFFLEPMQRKFGNKIAQLPEGWYKQQMNYEPKHWLIDEFQDLSFAQWAFLYPLLKESMRKGHESMIVGDVKQSIYRWRGGEPELFLRRALEDIGKERTVSKELLYNWRSAAQIVSFNNLFFKAAAAEITKNCSSAILKNNSLTPPKKREALEDCYQLIKAYAHVKQMVPSSSAANQGEVRISSLIVQQGEKSWQEASLKGAIQAAERLQKAGIPPNNITWLVRNNQEAQKIVMGLQRYPAKEEGISYLATTAKATTLGHQPVILLVITVLELIKTPQQPWLLAKLIHYYGLIKQKNFPFLSFKRENITRTLQQLLPNFSTHLNDWQLKSLKKNDPEHFLFF